MTDKTSPSDKELNNLLDTLRAPDPSADLAARILAKAESSPDVARAANDRGFPWKSLMAVAACLIAVAFVGFGYFGPSNEVEAEEAQWQQTAENTGFSELYDWVYAEGENGS